MDARGQNGAMRPGSVQGSDEGAPALRLRLLCPHTLVPALIGKKGDNVKRICRESGAAISVAEPVHGCDERVVHITGESVDAEGSCAADALVAVFESIVARGGDGSSLGAPPASLSVPSPPAASPRSDGACSASACGSAGGSLPDAPSVPSAAGSSASTHGDAVMGVAGPPSSGPASIAASSRGGQQRPVEARLLVDSALVGYLVGRGGNTIKETMAKSGAGVRVLPKSDLPPCGCIGDEVVRVCGSAGAVAAALRLLAGQIKAHPLRLGGLPYAGAPAGRPPLMLVQATHADLAYLHPSLGGYFAAGPGAPGAGGLVGGPMGHPALGGFCGTAVEVSFRLLAPVARAGNIIGKGGEHVRRVRQETGARIKVFDPAPGSEERVVALSSNEDALSPYCAAQDALIRCVIALAADDASAGLHRVRLLTAQASVGMVLGKRGATVSQLRQETGASIKVLPADLLPPAFGGADDGEVELGGSGAAAAAEEVVQVEGSVQQCVAALRGVATLLRGWQIRWLMSMQQQQYGGGAGAHAAAAAMQLPMPPQSMGMSPNSGMGMMSPASPGLMLPSTLGSPLQPGGYMMMQLPPGMMGPPPGHGMGGPSPHHMMQQRPAPVQYYYHLDNAQVGAVLGKGGSHIGQCRSVSGARVQLQGETEGGGRMLLVAGPPEQCHTAHSMINSFLSMGQCEPAYPEQAYPEPIRMG